MHAAAHTAGVSRPTLAAGVWRILGACPANRAPLPDEPECRLPGPAAAIEAARLGSAGAGTCTALLPVAGPNRPGRRTTTMIEMLSPSTVLTALARGRSRSRGVWRLLAGGLALAILASSLTVPARVALADATRQPEPVKLDGFDLAGDCWRHFGDPEAIATKGEFRHTETGWYGVVHGDKIEVTVDLLNAFAVHHYGDGAYARKDGQRAEDWAPPLSPGPARRLRCARRLPPVPPGPERHSPVPGRRGPELVGLASRAATFARPTSSSSPTTSTATTIRPRAIRPSPSWPGRRRRIGKSTDSQPRTLGLRAQGSEPLQGAERGQDPGRAPRIWETPHDPRLLVRGQGLTGRFDTAGEFAPDRPSLHRSPRAHERPRRCGPSAAC